MALTQDETPRSPDWWLLRLGRRMRDREKTLDLYWRYYKGRHPLPYGPPKVRDAYVAFQEKARTNLCGSVVRADVHRLLAIGVADGQGRPDAQAWTWWQQNKLDSAQKPLYRAACWSGEAYMIVGPHPRDPKRPLITPESPRQVIVEVDPATSERVAALKAWYDDIDKVCRATVYLDDMLVRYVTDRRGPSLPWGGNNWTVDGDVVEHGLEEVPVVPFPVRPDLGEDPEPVFWAGRDVQDRINVGMLDRMTAARYGAFRQRYVTGHVFDTERVTEVDPVSGLVVERTKAAPNPFRADPAAVWATNSQEARFGEFSQTELTGYLRAHQADIGDFFFMTDTPAYYMPGGDLINIGADTVAAMDTNHVSKILEMQAEFGEAHESVLELASRVAGEERDFTSSEIRWRDPRLLNPAVVADAATKMRALGVPTTMVAEEMGWSPQRVQRLRTESSAEQLRAQALARATATPPAQQPPPAGAGGAGG